MRVNVTEVKTKDREDKTADPFAIKFGRVRSIESDLLICWEEEEHQLCRDPIQRVCVLRKSGALPNAGFIPALRIPLSLSNRVQAYFAGRHCNDFDLLLSDQ